MNISESLIREIVEKVIRETMTGQSAPFEKHVDPSGIIGIKTSTVELEPFEGRSDVRLKDVTTLEEAPRMGCGIMELLDGASFEWTLTYDEYDVVLEGTLEIEIDGRIIKGDVGDIIYIPKGSHIHFQTPNHAKYVYTVFPADWQ
ncbi:MAG: ethanolamine utilization protein EutQ [Butyricicoccus pullicaecorum]|nr:ethanolamine utilization protein EutQ [Butyricicoccus pullicaecorum]